MAVEFAHGTNRVFLPGSRPCGMLLSAHLFNETIDRKVPFVKPLVMSFRDSAAAILYFDRVKKICRRSTPLRGHTCGGPKCDIKAAPAFSFLFRLSTSQFCEDGAAWRS